MLIPQGVESGYVIVQPKAVEFYCDRAGWESVVQLNDTNKNQQEERR